MTALDAIGPYEVLSRLPGGQVRFVGKEAKPVRTDNGMLSLHVDYPLAQVEQADILLVPGGSGTRQLLADSEVLDWIRLIDQTTTVTSSVCTGSLLLAAAGLLPGANAATHWLAHDELRKLGAHPLHERIVTHGKVVTAAGVSAGIDLALHLAGSLSSPDLAKALQLLLEYDPAPPYDCGSPGKAPASTQALAKEIRDKSNAPARESQPG